MTSYPSLDELKTYALTDAAYDLSWELLDTDPSARAELEDACSNASDIREKLERIYTRICNGELPDGAPEELTGPEVQFRAAQILAEALIECYCLLDVWDRYQLVRSITELDQE